MRSWIRSSASSSATRSPLSSRYSNPRPRRRRRSPGPEQSDRRSRLPLTIGPLPTPNRRERALAGRWIDDHVCAGISSAARSGDMGGRVAVGKDGAGGRRRVGPRGARVPSRPGVHGAVGGAADGARDRVRNGQTWGAAGRGERARSADRVRGVAHLRARRGIARSGRARGAGRWLGARCPRRNDDRGDGRGRAHDRLHRQERHAGRTFGGHRDRDCGGPAREPHRLASVARPGRRQPDRRHRRPGRGTARRHRGATEARIHRGRCRPLDRPNPRHRQQHRACVECDRGGSREWTAESASSGPPPDAGGKALRADRQPSHSGRCRDPQHGSHDPDRSRPSRGVGPRFPRALGGPASPIRRRGGRRRHHRGQSGPRGASPRSPTAWPWTSCTTTSGRSTARS